MLRSVNGLTAKFSTAAAAATNKHQAPLKLFGLPGRYATALYIASSKAGLLSKVDEELAAFNVVCQKNPNFYQFLVNPTIPRPEKCTKIADLLDEKKISFPTRNLLLTLAGNGRLSEYNNVYASFNELLQASKGVIKVVVFSADALDKKTVDALHASITKIAGKGKSIELSVEIKPEIVGGLQIMMGDKFLDLSVKSRMNQLSQFLDHADA